MPNITTSDGCGLFGVWGRGHVDERKMARRYEPSTRYHHSSSLVEGKVYMWGGTTSKSCIPPKQIEWFDPYLEMWNQVNTVGTPHPGQYEGACVSIGECMYMYGGCIQSRIYTDVLSCLDLNKLTWSRMGLVGTDGRPMKKCSCGMVPFHGIKLAVIGGFGIPTGSIQPGSTFIRNTRFSDGSGWTNEIHVFNICQGNGIISFYVYPEISDYCSLI